MLDAVLAKLHGRNIKKLTASNADAFLSDGSLPKVILFTSKDKPGHAYLALSMEYQHSLDFAHARDHETALGILFRFPPCVDESAPPLTTAASTALLGHSRAIRRQGVPRPCCCEER